MPASKKKRVSKKNKIAWRKHVDISDVENFLEERRFEERLGKLSEKSNEELFEISTKPYGAKEITSKQQKRMFLKNLMPKCFSMLRSHSEVPDPVIKRNRVKTKEERKNELVKRIEENKRKRGILKAKEIQSIKDKELELIKRSNKPKRGEIKEDIWNVENLDDNKTDEWITSSTFKHTLRGQGHTCKNVPKSVKRKTSVLQSIEPPHPGTSYNPSFQHHQELLKEVVEKELKIIKQEKHLNNVTKGMFKKVTPDEQNKNWLTEMLQGLEKQAEDVNDVEDNEYKSINPPVQNKKKNLKQRRIQKEQLQLKQLRENAKKEKKKVADIYKLKFLKKDLEEKNEKAKILRLKRLKKESYKKKEPKRLSNIKFEEQEIDFTAPQQIKGNLRALDRGSNLLLDRFKSLQKRNILQPTTKQAHKRAKIKRFQRPGHKDDWKVTVARAYHKNN